MVGLWVNKKFRTRQSETPGEPLNRKTTNLTYTTLSVFLSWFLERCQLGKGGLRVGWNLLLIEVVLQKHFQPLDPWHHFPGSTLLLPCLHPRFPPLQDLQKNTMILKKSINSREDWQQISKIFKIKSFLLQENYQSNQIQGKIKSDLRTKSVRNKKS